MSRERPAALPRAVPAAGSISRRGPARYTADSKRGKQLMAATTRIHEGHGLSPEQRAWNAQVEAKRQAKLERRRARGD